MSSKNTLSKKLSKQKYSFFIKILPFVAFFILTKARLCGIILLSIKIISEVTLMKKILALALAALMLLSLAACSKDNETIVGDQNADEENLSADEMIYNNLTYGINNENGLFEITGFVRTGIDQVDIEIPAEIDGRKVVGIADDAFKSDAAYIKSIKLPETIKYIGAHAFYGCQYITSITLPSSVTSIGNGAFENCIGLETIVLSENLVTISNGAFKNCTVLKNVTITANITTIGDSAFQNCKALEEIDLPESVITLGSAAFFDCDALAKVTVTANLKEIGEIVFNSCAEDLVITAPAGSEFEKYAIENEYMLAPITPAQ